MPGRKTGARLSGICLQWRRARRRAKLDGVRLHDLRHSFASPALALGETLPTIARLLGHTSVQITARYSHLARYAITVKEAAAKMAAEIGGDIFLGGTPGPASLALPSPQPDPGDGARGADRASAERVATGIGADILPR